MDIEALRAPFPPNEIEWRVGSTTGDKSKGLALAYLTSRHVMNRLDDVCGVANWMDRYEFHGPRTVCYLSIKIGDEWVTKADAAGDTQVESEKGSVSDALKRAAVKWGIGRYLYSLDNIWVELEAAGRSQKIKKSEYAKLERELSKRFGGSNSSKAVQVDDEPTSGRMSKAQARDLFKRMQDDLQGAANDGPDVITSLMKSDEMAIDLASLPADWESQIREDAKSLYRVAKEFATNNVNGSATSNLDRVASGEIQ